MIFAYTYLITLLIAPQLWVPSLKSLPIDYLIYPIWTVYTLLSGKLKDFRLTLQNKFLLFWFVWLVLSMAVNGSLDQKFPEQGFVLKVYFKFVWLYFLIAATVNHLEKVRRFIFFFILLEILLVAEGIQHKLTGIGWAGQTLGWIDPAVLAAGGSGRTRWIGIFDGPGVFCVVYTIALPFLLQSTAKVHRLSTRLCSIVLTIATLVAIYFNGSRGGFLTVLAILVMYHGRDLKVSKTKILFGIAIAFVLFLLAPSYMTTLNDSSKSGYHRVEMWAEGVEMAQQNPVFGIGRGNFRFYTSKLIAHNSAVEIMGETGLVGLFLWAGMIYFSIKNLFYFIKETNNDRDKLFVTGLLLSVIGYVLSSMFVTLEYETFYILLALCSVIGRVCKKPISLDRNDLCIVGFACMAFFITMKLFVMIYFAFLA